MTACAFLLLVTLFAPPDSAERKISAEKMLEQVSAFCDQALKGRMALNEGAHKVADLIADSFEQSGLQAVGDGGLDYPLTVVLDVLDKDINPEGDDLVYEMNPAGLTERRCPAVMACIEGRKADVKDNVVLVIARYDGQGRDGRKTIYPSADRNASGVSVMLEVARVLAKHPGGVYRTVVFVALPAGEEGIYMRPAMDGAIYERIDNWVLKYLVTTGEWDLFLESDLIRLPGLAGAEAWIAASPLHLKKIHTVVDLNMVGRKFSFGKDADHETGAMDGAEDRGYDLAVVGAETGEGLARTVERACKGGAVDVSLLSFDAFEEKGIKRATESVCFVRKRIPSLWITAGPHGDHGTERDSPDRLDGDQLEKAARLAYRLVKTLANEKRGHTFTR